MDAGHRWAADTAASSRQPSHPVATPGPAISERTDMRRPLESAITRRDDHLARTRRLSLWIAGGAAAASVSLATAFGFALPGHAVTSGGQAPARHAGHSTGQT